MLPIGMLMGEHRLIERMVRRMAREGEEILRGKKVDVGLIEAAIDFIRNYADKCHHGKEEAILFRDAGPKPLAEELRSILTELLSEHDFGRQTTTSLEDAKNRYEAGDDAAVADIVKKIQLLVEFYPRHIDKEDKHFFLPCITYFTKTEQDDMLNAFLKFDQSLIHDLYRRRVEKYEMQG
jgi:hemerythrin-like domain-containing protein